MEKEQTKTRSEGGEVIRKFLQISLVSHTTQSMEFDRCILELFVGLRDFCRMRDDSVNFDLQPVVEITIEFKNT